MAINRIVIVGCGSIGQRHARLLVERQNLEIELCDPSRERLDQALAVTGDRKCYDNFQEALDSAPDAMILATPHALHADQSISALLKAS